MGKDKKYIVFSCTLPECNHYLPEKLAIGKASVCWACNEKMILKKPLRAKPTCGCKTRPKVEVAKVENVLDLIGIKL